MSTCYVQLFGVLQVSESPEQKEIIKIRRCKARALLAYLLLNAKRCSRLLLATMFYPDQCRRTGLKRLRRILAELNQSVLRPHICASREYIEIPTCNDDLNVDVLEFNRLKQRIRQMWQTSYPESAPQIQPLLEKAMNLYKGNLLEGSGCENCPRFDTWRMVKSNILHNDYLDMHEKLIKVYAQKNELMRAIEITYCWLQMAPLDEAPRYLLMLLYAHARRRSEALMQYESFSEKLYDELGTYPTQSMQELYRSIRIESELPAIT